MLAGRFLMAGHFVVIKIIQRIYAKTNNRKNVYIENVKSFDMQNCIQERWAMQLKYDIDGNIRQPENSNDGYKNYTDSTYERCSHNHDGTKTGLIRLSFDRKMLIDSLVFYSRGGRGYALPDKLKFFGSNKNSFELSDLDLIGTVEGKILQGDIFIGIIKFEPNMTKGYKYILFNFEPTESKSGTGNYWYWNELEVFGKDCPVLFATGDNKINAINYIENETPIMTSNTLPWGEVKASSYYSSYYPYRAFNGITEDWISGWLSRLRNVRNEWISFTFPKQTYIEKYEIYAVRSSYMPRDFVLLGSNDEVHWERLDEQSLTLSEWKADQWNTFVIKNPKEYKTYRLFCFNNNGGNNYIAIPEMRLSGIKREVIEISYQSPEDFMKYGTSLGELRQINFSIQFNKKRYIENKHTQLENGKVYNQKLSQSPAKICIK